MKWSRNVLIGVVVGIAILGLAILYVVTMGTEQVSSEEASTLNFGDDQLGTFVLVVGGIVTGVIAVGVALAAIVYLANLNVKRAEETEDIPQNPLDYRNYGYLGWLVTPALLFAVAMFFMLGMLPEAASEEADRVDLLFAIEGFFIALIFGGVSGTLIHFLFYYRAREDEMDQDGVFLHGNNLLEITWTAIPALLVLALGTFTVFLFSDVMAEDDNEVVIHVQAQQWAWGFEYPIESIPEGVRARILNADENNAELFCGRNADSQIIDAEGNYIDDGNLIALDGTILAYNVEIRQGGVISGDLPDEEGNLPEDPEHAENITTCVPLQSFSTTNSLYLLQGQPVVFEMQSIDVIHSFWIPQMRIKQDVTPGVVTELRYTPTTEGEYQVVCTELCGLLHSQMLADVNVVSEAVYETWVETNLRNQADPVAAGQAIWEGNCSSCHSIDGSAGSGPTWLNIYGAEHIMSSGERVIVDDEYIRQSIMNPQARIVDPASGNYPAGTVMPMQNLSDVEINQVIAFIKSDEVSPAYAESQQAEATTE